MAGWRTPTGGCERKHPISNTTKERNHTLKVREGEGPWHVSETGNEIRCTQTRGAQQAKSPLLLRWPTQRKRMPTTSPPPAANLLSTADSKAVRFRWVILCYFTYLYIKQKAQDSSEIHRSPWNCVSSVRKLLRVTLLPPRTWRWHLNL